LIPFRAFDYARFELGLPWKRPLGIGSEALDTMAMMQKDTVPQVATPV
jgi:hypothetical protein